MSIQAASTDVARSVRGPRGGPRRRRRGTLRRLLVRSHRWPALVLGLVLVAETTSGAVLLYQGDLFHALHGQLFRHTAAQHPLTPDAAIGIVRRAHPAFDASWVATDRGVYAVGNASYATQYYVDPGSGRINGSGDLNRGVLGLLANLHECGFTCQGMPGYNGWLAGALWPNGPTFLDGITRGGFALGLLGFVLIGLVVSSVRLWWPGRRRLRARATVRFGRGRFARDQDLHNIVGAVALPFLLLWGITGAALEFPVVENAWVTLTGGTATTPVYAVTPNPATAHAATITPDTAIRSALAAAPGEVAFLGVPTKDTPYYEIDVQTGDGSSAYRAIYHGDAYVYVDAHDAANVHTVDGGGPLANRFYDKFLEPSHFGWNVNPWWRALWFAFGVAPLVLMVTGVSTWLVRRSARRRRRRAAT